jgi:hypothetical protein
LSGVGLQPFHCARDVGANVTVRFEQKAVAGVGVSGASVPRYSATAMRSSRFIVIAIASMAPASSVRTMRAAGICRSAERCGMRSSTCSWQSAQCSA